MSAELFEVVLVDGESRWSAAWLSDDEADRLLHVGGRVRVFPDRDGVARLADEMGLRLVPDDPDEIDLDLGGWLPRGAPQPTTAEVSELWHLLLDDPVAGTPLAPLEEAYDDLTDDEPDFFDEHGETARRALAQAVGRLREVLAPS